MKFICDAPPYTWFRIESEGEAAAESKAMDHAVEKYFRQAHEAAVRSYVPPSTLHSFEPKIGLKAHVQRQMPLFLTLRDNSGVALVTAMLPPEGRSERSFRTIIVGQSNLNPYLDYDAAIAALAAHFGLTLDSTRCYPYRGG